MCLCVCVFVVVFVLMFVFVSVCVFVCVFVLVFVFVFVFVFAFVILVTPQCGRYMYMAPLRAFPISHTVLKLPARATHSIPSHPFVI